MVLIISPLSHNMRRLRVKFGIMTAYLKEAMKKYYKDLSFRSKGWAQLLLLLLLLVVVVAGQRTP